MAGDAPKLRDVQARREGRRGSFSGPRDVLGGPAIALDGPGDVSCHELYSAFTFSVMHTVSIETSQLDKKWETLRQF